jgi:protein disulfide-isomerase A6
MKEEKESMPEMEMRKQEAEAIMQGKGYGNPHAGMAVGDDGIPLGANPHAHGHAGFNPHDPEFMKAHGSGDPHGHGHGHPHPHSGTGEEAQKPLGQSQADFEDNSSAGDEKEMGDDDEESVNDGIGRETTDEL